MGFSHGQNDQLIETQVGRTNAIFFENKLNHTFSVKWDILMEQ